MRPYRALAAACIVLQIIGIGFSLAGEAEFAVIALSSAIIALWASWIRK